MLVSKVFHNSSCFITIYKTNETTWYKREEKRRKEKEKSMEDEKKKGIVWREKLTKISKE